MPAEPIRVGPFTSGLNTFSDASSVPDNGLVECINFELDLDGSLRSRPPAEMIGNSLPLQAVGHARVLGTYRQGLIEHLIASDGDTRTYAFDGSTWTLITNTFAASAVTQFQEQLWLLSPVGEASDGGTWVPGGSFTAVPDLPHGGDIIGHKNRLWVIRGKEATSEGTRLYFSNVFGTSPFWPVAPNFIDVGNGDGENIVGLATAYGSLLMWRLDSIMRYTYTADPAGGEVALVVPNVGLENRDSLTAYESVFYFQHRGRAYELVNMRANQINNSVTFKEEATSSIVNPYAVSLFNQRVLFQWWDVTYVFNLRTRTWTTWETSVHGGFGKWFTRIDADLVPEALCIPNRLVDLDGSRSIKIVSMQDTYNTRKETMLCIARTKNYDYESSTLFKRLFVWTVSAAWNGDLRAIASAISFREFTTWGALRAQHTWGSLRTQTWGTLSSDTTEHTTDRNSVGSGPQRKEAKAKGRIRFKRINYRVEIESDGSSTTAPVRLFYLTTYVRAGQLVSKDVS